MIKGNLNKNNIVSMAVIITMIAVMIAGFIHQSHKASAEDLIVYEDLTTFTEVDVNDRYTVTSTAVTVDGLERSDGDNDEYIYKDYGVDNFDGDFTHLVSVAMSTSVTENYANYYCWMLSNNLGGRTYHVTNNYSFLGVSDSYMSAERKIYLYEQDGSSTYSDSSIGLVKGAIYDLVIDRDETVGTYGTIYVYIYSNASEELIDTLTVTLHSSKKDFRYLYCANHTYATGEYTYDGWGGYLSISQVSNRNAVIDENDDVDTVTDGTEEVNAVDWITPRCAYADEDIGFLVTGDSGAEIDMKLYDGNGVEIDVVADSVRVDGYYRWTVEVPPSQKGFIRAYENNSGIYSDWGYCMPEPEEDQVANSVQALNADYPQWFEPWYKYRAIGNTVMVYHYKVAVSTSDFSEYSFRLWHLGDSGSEVYNETLADICDDYFCNDADNDSMAQWRYMLFSFNGGDLGLNDRDGLIQDLEIEYSYSTSGFYQGLVYEDGVAGLTDTKTCYWYNKYNNDGITWQINSANLGIGNELTITLDTGDYSHILTELSTVDVELYIGDEDNIGTLLYTYDDEILTDNMHVFDLELPSWVDDYYIKLTMHGSSSYNHVMAIPISVTSSGGDGSAFSEWFDLLGKFDESMGNFGLGGSAGHIFLMCIGMVGSFIIFHKSRLMRIIIPVSIFALSMAMGWVPVWMFVLIAMGAGLLVTLGITKVITGNRGG